MNFLPTSFRLAGALLGIAAAVAVPALQAQPANKADHSFAHSQRIADRYIVVLKDSADPVAEANAARGQGHQVHHVYTSAIKGFAASLPAAALNGILNNPNVDYVEADQTVSLNTTQNSATWGLDRIDQRDRPLDLLYHYNYTGSDAGVTVKAFIIDTGIRATHVEIAGRVLTGSGFTSISDGNGTNDCNGHGTHVSGTVGGNTWGVAKQVQLVPVRVLDCRGSGSWSGVIAGIDYAANSSLRPAVANMSLGGGKSTAVNAAVAGAVTKGVTMVVAAGNDNLNACNYSPASEPTAITVGSTTSADARSSFSNFGTCVDLFAPGSSITSSWNTSNTAANTISGTSMATPHVAGAAALALQANPTASPAAIANLLVSTASVDKVTSPGTGSPNLLLYSMVGPGAVEPTNPVIAIKSLTGIGVKVAKNWKAQVTASVRDLSTGGGVANVTVTGLRPAPPPAASPRTPAAAPCKAAPSRAPRRRRSSA
jgi:aqualysin 1